jgi:hypothetical protein
MQLPVVVLKKIFSFIQNSPFERGKTPLRTIVSHVARQWRISAIDTPSLWGNVRVTRALQLSGLREILPRSRGCDLHIIIISNSLVANTPSRRMSHRLHFRDAMIILIAHIQRWCTLSVTAKNDVLRVIMGLVSGVPIYRLQSLELVQSDDGPIYHCGPLSLNSSVFTILRLTRVTIHCVSPTHFTGLTDLEVTQTSCSIIDQELLDTLGNVISPTHPPTMLQLSRLAINAKNPLLPLHLSFHVSSLVSLKLAGLSDVSQTLIAPFTHLFNLFSSATLRHLELQGIVGVSWDGFVDSLTSTHIPKYPGLQSLTLKSLKLRRIDATFPHAFPAITHLHLIDIDSDPNVIAFLQRNFSASTNITIAVDGSEVL